MSRSIFKWAIQLRLTTALRFLLGLCAGATLSVGMANAQPRQPRVLMISPEQSGIFQTGGLAHASTGLAGSLNAAGISTDVLMPYYLEMTAPEVMWTGQNLGVDLDWREGRPHKRSLFSVLKTKNQTIPTVFLKHENAAGTLNYFDNRTSGGGKKFYAPEATIGESFGAFDKAAVEYILSQDYDIVILNDWTTGLIATLLQDAKAQGRKVPKVIFAIHNIAYQGLFPKSLGDFLGLDSSHFTPDGYEFYGQMNLLKAGMIYSDMVYTVSKQYAQEIATPRFGAGLDGVVRFLQARHQVLGILNGITESDWDPSAPMPGMDWTFNGMDLSGKAKGKAEMQKQLNLPVDSGVEVSILTSRLAEQKGFEYLIDAIDTVAQDGTTQWVIIGEGESQYVEKLRALEKRFPKNVRYLHFSSALEHQLTRYSDYFVNAAWFEPSGLNQFFALKNGTIPILSAVGGSIDSVKNDETGILFPIIPGQNGENYDKIATHNSLVAAFRKASALFKNPERFQQMRQKGMAESNSWGSRVNSDFLPLFHSLMDEKCSDRLVKKTAPPGT